VGAAKPHQNPKRVVRKKRGGKTAKKPNMSRLASKWGAVQRSNSRERTGEGTDKKPRTKTVEKRTWNRTLRGQKNYWEIRQSGNKQTCLTRGRGPQCQRGGVPKRRETRPVSNRRGWAEKRSAAGAREEISEKKKGTTHEKKNLPGTEKSPPPFVTTRGAQNSEGKKKP